MSAGLAVSLMVAGLVFVAALWIALTRRTSSDEVPALPVVWMWPRDGGIGHLFRVAELRDELADVEPLAHCGRWRVAELVSAPLMPAELLSDDDADRCVPCGRAVEQMEHRHQ